MRRTARRAQAQSFDRVARDYDRLAELDGNALIGPRVASLLPARDRAAHGRALDLGCGAGRHTVLLAQRFAHVDAVDLSGPMIEVAQAGRPRPNISYRQADLLDVGGAGQYIVSRGPAVAWEIYRLSTRRVWLDHRVSDRFFSRRELERSCQALFPGHQLEVLGGPRGVVLRWDAPG
jgi:SAM-dependent methyltransferase